MLKSAAQEAALANVCLNTIAPGPIATEMLECLTGGNVSGFVGMIPMGRAGRTSEMANTVLYHAPGATSAISG